MSKEIEALMREALAKAWDEGAQFDPDPVSRKNPYRSAPPDPEPDIPAPCSNCGRTYEACNNLLRAKRRCCCMVCFETATHNQHAWEAWDRRQKKGRG